jgi:hypothetical protein
MLPPWLPVAGLTPVTVGASEVTEKPAGKVPRPAGVPTPTKRVPTKARLAITIFAVIWVSLSTLKLVTSMPPPNDTPLAPVKPVPVIVTATVCP